MKRKLVCIVLAVSLSLIPVVSYASQDSAENVTIRVWSPTTRGEPIYEGLVTVKKAFEQVFPNIKVEIETIQWGEIHDKVLVSAQAGNPPDISYILGEWYVEFAKMGFLQDLTPWVNEWAAKELIYPNCWQAAELEGKIKALPHRANIRTYVYREDLFKEAGIGSPPATWKELQQEVGPKVTKDTDGDGKIDVWGFGWSTTSARSPQEFIPYFWQSEADLVTEMPDGKFKNLWQEDEKMLSRATEPFQFYHDNVYKFKISPIGIRNWGYVECDTSYGIGTIASQLGSTWIKYLESKHPETIKVTKFADVPYNRKPATLLDISFLGIYKEGHPKEAFEFAKFLQSYVGQMLHVEKELATHKDISRSEDDKIAWSLVDHAYGFKPISWGKINDKLIEAEQNVLFNKMTPREAALWLSKEINEALEEQGELSSY